MPRYRLPKTTMLAHSITWRERSEFNLWREPTALPSVNLNSPVAGASPAPPGSGLKQPGHCPSVEPVAEQTRPLSQIGRREKPPRDPPPQCRAAERSVQGAGTCAKCGPRRHVAGRVDRLPVYSSGGLADPPLQFSYKDYP